MGCYEPDDEIASCNKWSLRELLDTARLPEAGSRTMTSFSQTRSGACGTSGAIACSPTLSGSQADFPARSDIHRKARVRS
jgi:hypothetical protein